MKDNLKVLGPEQQVRIGGGVDLWGSGVTFNMFAFKYH